MSKSAAKKYRRVGCAHRQVSSFSGETFRKRHRAVSSPVLLVHAPGDPAIKAAAEGGNSPSAYFEGDGNRDQWWAQPTLRCYLFQTPENYSLRNGKLRGLLYA